MCYEELKHYTINLFVEGLQKINFLNYERFSNIDAVYTNFLTMLMKVINEITPSIENSEQQSRLT